MKMIANLIILLILFGYPVMAEQLNFETTSEGMIKALSDKPQESTIKTRGFKPSKSQGATRGLKVPSEPLKTRTINVVRKKNNVMVEETETVPEVSETPHVNLKIEFDYNSYAIRPGSYKLLNELGQAITSKKLQNKRFELKGHTDSDGSQEYNLKLSYQRAEAVKSYIAANFQIEANRLNLVGYGEALPLVPNDSARNKQINRRVEVSITD